VSRKSAGFVNAVLRKAADLELPEAVGVRTSHPDWLIERWRKRFAPKELAAILEADNAVLPVTIRPNPLKAAGRSSSREIRRRPALRGRALHGAG
jgi:16S rRNA (cytosine967-C5)-methyltransferase